LRTAAFGAGFGAAFGAGFGAAFGAGFAAFALASASALAAASACRRASLLLFTAGATTFISLLVFLLVLHKVFHSLFLPCPHNREQDGYLLNRLHLPFSTNVRQFVHSPRLFPSLRRTLHGNFVRGEQAREPQNEEHLLDDGYLRRL
jgi:hypothetical protein